MNQHGPLMLLCLNALHQLVLLMTSANITDSDEILRRVSLATSENLDLMDPKAQRCVIYKENQVLLIFADSFVHRCAVD